MERILLLLFSFIIEAIIFGLYSSKLFFSSFSIPKKAVVISAAYGSLFFISISGITWVNTIAYFIINLALLFVIFKLQVNSAFFHALLLTAIMGISELALFILVNKYNVQIDSSTGMGLLFYTVCSKLFFLTVIFLLTYVFRPQKEFEESYDRTDYVLVTIPLVSIFIVFVFLNIYKSPEHHNELNLLVMISTFLLLGTNLLIFALQQYNQKKRKEFLELQLLLQKESDSVEYHKMMLTQSENQNILIHDIKNHLQSINLLNSENENEKITTYINRLLHSSDLKEFSKICENTMLNAILCRYQRKCTEGQILFYADVRNHTIDQISENDLTTLFGNLLDNAYESAVSIPDSFIELTVQRKENSPLILITLINSCRSMPSFSYNHLPLTTKKEKRIHGFGMKSIQKTAHKYHGELKTYFDNKTGTFHTIITLKV